jgi:hypothetical protein
MFNGRNAIDIEVVEAERRGGRAAAAWLTVNLRARVSDDPHFAGSAAGGPALFSFEAVDQEYRITSFPGA